MSYIPDALRQQVATRANHRCEYCLIHQEVRLAASRPASRTRRTSAYPCGAAAGCNCSHTAR